MIKIIITILIIVTGKCAFAQHIGYSDKTNLKTDLIKEVKAAKSIYHDWPDRCPGVAGSIPVLTNYVPMDIVQKLTEIYKGHLYSITSRKADKDKLQYKLQICVKGETKYEYADETGTIIK
jgi:hypothetical protein